MRGFKAISDQRSAVSKRKSVAFAHHSSLITHHLSPRPAFTLVELIVSVAILLALMAMIAMIFSTAGKASGTAQASTTLYRQLRQITDSIRQDLKAMDPATGVMAIAGVAKQAYLTTEEKANNGTTALHRADVFMLLTPREFEPFVYSGSGTFENYRQVIYGHANLGRINPGTGAWLGSLRMVEGQSTTVPSDIPASEWHLARRIVGFTKAGLSSGTNNSGGWPLTGASFTGNCVPTLYADVYQGDWTTFDANIWYGYFHYKSLVPDLVFCASPAYPDEKFLLGSGRYAWDSATAMWYVYQSGNDWIRKAAPSYEWYFTSNQSPPATSDFGSAASGTLRCWPEWFYASTGGTSRLALDPSPPIAYGQRLAGYFLPGCSDFQVEYTYDDPREIALETTGAHEPLLANWLDQDKDGNAEKYPAPRPINWQMVQDDEQIVWSKLSVDPDYYSAKSGEVDLRNSALPYFCRWPKAVRITIRVYDPSHRLKEPVTQTIVHTF